MQVLGFLCVGAGMCVARHFCRRGRPACLGGDHASKWYEPNNELEGIDKLPQVRKTLAVMLHGEPSDGHLDTVLVACCLLFSAVNSLYCSLLTGPCGSVEAVKTRRGHSATTRLWRGLHIGGIETFIPLRGGWRRRARAAWAVVWADLTLALVCELLAVEQ